MSSDEQALRELVATWMRATQAGDTATVLSLMTDDVVFLVAGRPAFGKEAFRAASNGQTDFTFTGTSTIEELEVHGDWAWMRSSLTVIVTPKNGAPPIHRAGPTLTLFRKEGGRWLLARDANLLTVVPAAS